MSSFPILSVITFLPLLAIPLVALIPKELPGTARNVTLGFMLATFAASMVLFFRFNELDPAFQFVENVPWIGDAIHYKIGVDGISILLVALTTFLTPIAFLGAYRSITDKVKEFCIVLLILETAMLGTFLAMDLFLFYIFWELMLIPMYFLIGVWGGKRRIYATVKFVLFTMVGSVLMLVAIIYLYMRSGGVTFDYNALIAALGQVGKAGALTIKEQVVLFGAFGLAFAIKIPMFPFHTWLPDAHVEAPTAGSVILAGVLLKMGTYGFLRYAIPIFHEAAALFSAPLMGLAVVGIIYGALLAFAQEDVKKLVAYSSVSHLGFVMLGMFAMTREGIQGSILQMVNHGLSTGALFLCVGFLYERRHTRLIEHFGGIARVLPFFAVVFMITVFSSIGLPGTNGFVGEFLILAGVFKEAVGSAMEPGLFNWRNFVLVMGVLACTGVVLGAVYMLNMTRKVMFGPITHEENKKLKDLSWREKLVIIPVIAMILFIGLAPGMFVSKMKVTVDRYVQTHQTRMMKQRNKATSERNDNYLKQVIQQKIQSQMGGAVNMENIKWQVGPYQGGGK